MSDTQWVSLAYGKINLAKQGQTVASLRLQPPFKRDAATQTGRIDLNSKQYNQATRFNDSGGGFTRQRVEHPVGTLILLQITRTKDGRAFSEGAIILRMRPGADMLSISAKLPRSHESILGDSIQIFAGEADLINANEAQVMGIVVPRFYAQQYLDEREVAELFDIDVVRKGQITKPTLQAVATSEGIVVRAVSEEAPRRIRLRRNNAD